jgi:predicted TIM-barrel fold metal-dependent hydrolase
LFKLDDAELQAACFRVYNDWLSQYCAVAPDKLVGVACIPLYDVDAGVRELERAKGLGLKGALVWEAPPAGLEFYTDHYERFWTAAQALEMPVSLHILTGHDWSKRVSDEAMTGVNLTEDEKTALGEFRLRGVANYKLLTSINALHDLIMAGVLERYPQLKVVLVEAEIGWIPFVLNQWDKYYERPNLQFPEMRMSPSDYFARQVFATFFNDIPGTRQLSWWGQDNCMWSNDFPHPNSTWPHSHDIIRRDLAALSPDVQSRLLWRNCAELYDTPLPSAVETSP